ncbi:MAG: DegT/DnrJ/EryC1/StrS family aminotransferase [Clostridia bacterium]|nr:DegT/DnrJ/EryC1/StrS family aminotransferase [Clostridia bacterium]NCD02760.1 DegT/DnrJ/EryC1/StrS family aminotransferase [Clostridia bacterium]
MQKILVTRSSMPSYEEYIEKIKPLWDSHWLTNMGVYHNEFESKLMKKMSTKNISLFTNGHMALELAIKALGLTGEVITTPFTFVSTTHAIVRNGLKPVFCDISLEDYTIDVTKIEGLITERTSAIIPVHVYGHVCDVDAIQEIADKYGLKVIYDAAHAFGETYNGKSIANYGDMSMFSFHATKVFNSIEGGAVAYNNHDYKTKLENLKNFGICSEEEVEVVAPNAKMNEFQAAMGLCNLEHLDGEIAKRKKVFDTYMERLDGVKGIQLWKLKENLEYNYAYLPVVFNEKEFPHNRNDIYEKLKSREIYARKYFYPLTNKVSCYKEYAENTELKNAEYVADRILALPMYADLEIEDVHRICDIILDIK